MPDIVLKDYKGSPQTYEGIQDIEVLKPDGTVQMFYSDPRPFDVHAVTFMNGDKLLYVRSVADGDNCADVLQRGLIETPTQESTDQYDFTFYGWGAEPGGAADSTILQNITGDKTIYAIYAATVRHYTVTYYDEDGVTVLHTEQVAYGDTPAGFTPEKDGFYFDKWEPELSPVTGDTSYRAVWTLEAFIASGSCGTAAEWILYSDGVFRVYGTGQMTNYENGKQPWSAYLSSINEIVIEDGITRIGSQSFRGSNVTKLTIPDSLVSFGKSAFYDCTKLTGDIVIPLSVNSIEAYAFGNCSGLTSIKFLEQASWSLRASATASSGKIYLVSPSGNEVSTLSSKYANKYWVKK